MTAELVLRRRDVFGDGSFTEMKKIITVGGPLADSRNDVLDAIHKVEAGQQIEAADKVNFASWSALAAVMSDKRLELLQHLRQHPAENVRQLAAALGRDYKRVYEDVARLEEAGLIDRAADGCLCVLWSEIQAVVSLDHAA